MVKEYICDFVVFVNNVLELMEVVLELVFMVGLKLKIRVGVKMFEFRILKKMMSLVKMVEEWLMMEIMVMINLFDGNLKNLKFNLEKGISGLSFGNGFNSYKFKM